VGFKTSRAQVKCARALVVMAAFALLPSSAALAQQATKSAEVETLDADVDPLYREGRFDEAIALAERALSIQERTLGPEHPGVVNAINNLALLYRAAGDYVAAETLFERVLEITTDTLGPRDPAIAITINNLGMLYWEQGDHARAARYLDKALSIWERSLGPDRPEVAVSLSNLASLYRKTGNFERAEPLYEKALSIWEKSPDPIHDQLVDVLHSLAAIRQGNGDYERAESFLKRALALEEKAHGADHTETAVALSNLASLYYGSGDYARARPLLERVLAIMEGARGPDHPDVASALSNLASVHAAMGKPASAEPLYERALEIRSEALGSDHLAVAASLENLASLYRAQGEFARSRPLCERALVIRVANHGPEHLDVARITSDLGATHWELGDFAIAEPLFERALLIREKALGPEHPAVATSVDNLASVYLAQGHHARAKPLYEAALAIREKAFGPEHPAVVQSLRNLGLMHWAKGDWEQAESYLVRTAEIEERQISLLPPVQFEDRTRAFMEALSNTTSLILSFQSKRPDQRSTTRLALTTVLRRKGRELSVEAGESAAFRRRLGDQERAVFDSLLAHRNELGRLIVRGSDRPRSRSLRASVEKLRREVGDLEKAAVSGGAARRSWAAPIQIEDLQPRIPADAALVELVEYQDFDPTRISADRARGVARLAAFVLRSSGAPRWVPLGEAAAINASVGAFREVLVDPDVSLKKLRERARDLYDRLAAPLDPHLEGIRVLLVAPDGAAVLVPFGALIDPDGRYWIERYEFAYLTSGRDLLLPNSALPSPGPPLVIAAPDYDAEHPAGRRAIGEAPTRLLPEIAAPHFSPIALSQTGALDVGRLLGVTPLTGAQASDAAIKTARAPRVLHIAVDGFFLPDQAREPTVRWGSILGIDPGLRPPNSENPLLRSGLALAGANRRANDADRGLLTALEIADLDLWGTQLVAIAVRGIGSEEAAVDQAVYALRRSLVIAGAQSQFMNLWKTDHRAAIELTTTYYERLLAGEGRSEALRSVQLAMLRSESRSHPFYWAGFISIGARGPIAWTDSREAVQEISSSP
jgi:tetratricopeptide (TPR) repeat protein